MVHVVVLFPYFLYAWTIWHLSRLLRSEDCYNEICPGLYVGRRAFASELPKDVRAVADLTAEFAEPREVRDGRRYLCLPTLDASVPPETEFREFVQAILSESGPTYLHCAEGHGRSGMVAAALLVSKGRATDLEDAVAQLREARPGIRLNQRQAALVARVSSTPQADVMRGRRKTVLPVFTERGRTVQRITSLLQLLGLERRARRSQLEVAFTAASANPPARKPVRSGSLFELAGRRGFPPEDCRPR